MAGFEVRVMEEGLPYGARVKGIGWDSLTDEAVRRDLNALFLDKGMIVFEDMEPSSRLQVELGKVFAPLKPPLTSSKRETDNGTEPLSVLDLHYNPGSEVSTTNGKVEMGGKELAAFSPWHFDHCYNDALNRGAVLRSPIIAPEGGRTGFLDGIALYNAFPRHLRDQLEGRNIIYVFDTRLSRMKFGANFRVVVEPPGSRILAEGARFPRAMQPAIWTRSSGEKVLHVGPWTSVGLEHDETPDGDALLREVCEEINRLGGLKGCGYWHDWKPTDMILWDNWRMIHAVEGVDPNHERRTLRVTLQGDYGLGYFEDGKKVGEVQREIA